MRERPIRVALSGSMLALLAVAMPGALPAEARIVCRDGAQLVAGSYISTPYCEDELLAVVAREYGLRHSADAIRSNPNLKRHVCRFVGHDIRVSQNCPPGARGRYR